MQTRFFGLDLHKKYATVCAISQQGQVLLREERLSLDQLPRWAARTLRPTDAVALEATTNVGSDWLKGPHGSRIAFTPSCTETRFVRLTATCSLVREGPGW